MHSLMPGMCADTWASCRESFIDEEGNRSLSRVFGLGCVSPAVVWIKFAVDPSSSSTMINRGITRESRRQDWYQEISSPLNFQVKNYFTSYSFYATLKQCLPSFCLFVFNTPTMVYGIRLYNWSIPCFSAKLLFLSISVLVYIYIFFNVRIFPVFSHS